jgi:hypothetical protein
MSESLLPTMVQRNLMKSVAELKRENPEAQTAFDRMVKRGQAAHVADEEIARALLGCMWEVSRGMPDRFGSVLKALGDGRTTEELFPNDLYADEGGKP